MNDQQAAIISVISILFILCVFVRCMKKIDEAEKGEEIKVDDIVHIELLRTMPGICRNQYNMTSRDILDNVCNVTVSGEYDKQIFCVRFQTSDAMGEHRVINVIKLDKNSKSLELQENFKEMYAITGYKNDTFIKRLGRRICSICPGCCGKLNIG